MAASQDDSDIEEISDPIRKKGKAKATESDDEDDQVRAAATGTRKNRKRKATSNDDDVIQIMERPKKQKTKSGRAGSEIKDTARTRTKPSSKPIAAKASEEKDDNGVREPTSL